MKLILYVAALLCSVIMQAQDFQGMAVYKSKISLPDDIKIEGNGIDPAMADVLRQQMNSSTEQTFILNFDKNASIYKEDVSLKPQMPEGVNISVSSSGSEGLQYKNIKDKRLVIETEFFDKEFLITDSLKHIKWEITQETKKIGNYTCYKATAILKNALVEEEDKKEESKNSIFKDMPKDHKVTAWYTPEIPISQGPEAYWGLPGLILEIQDETVSLLCTKVVLNTKEKAMIKEPKKGKKVSRAEFDKITREKYQELSDQHGKDGNVIIIGG